MTVGYLPVLAFGNFFLLGGFFLLGLFGLLDLLRFRRLLLGEFLFDLLFLGGGVDGLGGAENGRAAFCGRRRRRGGPLSRKWFRAWR